MLEKLKNLIYKKFILFLGEVISIIFFYLSIKNLNFYPLLVFILLFLGFYYLRGVESILASLLIPIPLILISVFSKINILILILFWICYIYIFLHKPKVGWIIFIFFLILFSNLLFSQYSVFLIFTLFFIVLLIVTLAGFKNNLLNSLIKALITSEIFWLSYFLPFNFYIRSFIVIIFFIWILSKEIL